MCITNSNDTLKGETILITNLFDKTLINELSFKRSIVLIDEAGKRKIKSSSIKYLEFIDFKNNKRVFVSKESIPKLKHSNTLYEQVVDGKISCYKSYYPHAYDGSVMETYHFFVNDEEKETLSVFGSTKKVLKRLVISERPDLSELIDNMKDKNTTDRRLSVMEIISLYNQNAKIDF